MKIYKLLCVTFVCGSLFAGNAFAKRIHFNTVDLVNISGTTAFGIDTNGDSIDDLMFSTEDPVGFSHEIAGPYIDFDPSYRDFLGISSNNSPDFKVDFVNGIRDQFTFGLVSSSFEEKLNISVFDSSDNLLPSTIIFPHVDGAFSHNNINFLNEVSFTGIASYALIDASGDNIPSIIGLKAFIGTFSPNDSPDSNLPIPAPSAIWLFGSGLIGLIGIKNKN